MRARLAAIALSACATLAACGPAAVRRDSLAAETHFLGPYIAMRHGRCTSGSVVLIRHATSNMVIETLPPIHEVGWELQVCGETLQFDLDCAARPAVGVRCRAHDWPTPEGDEDWPPGLEAAAAIRAAPPCPAGRSCRERPETSQACSEDAVRAERLEHHVEHRGDGAHWAVERCGVRRRVRVACTLEAPRTCTAHALGADEVLAAPPAASPPP